MPKDAVVKLKLLTFKQMSKIRTKIKYIDIGAFGEPIPGYLYCERNSSCDTTFIYDDGGDLLCILQDSHTHCKLDQLIKLLDNWKAYDKEFDTETWNGEFNDPK